MKQFTTHCSACGLCCDSPPLLTARELFRFRKSFIGALSIKTFASSARDQETVRCRDWMMLRIQSSQQHVVTHVALLLRGYDYDGRSCPALGEGGKCGLHGRGKPGMCRAVPQDPFVADADQNALLSARAGLAPFVQIGCIRADPHGESPALQPLRNAVMRDRLQWGEAVWRRLAGALPPTSDELVLPLVPVVEVIASRSARNAELCAVFLKAQRELIARVTDEAVRRRNPAERGMTERLRAWSSLYKHLLDSLDAMTSGRPRSVCPADVVEARP